MTRTDNLVTVAFSSLGSLTVGYCLSAASGLIGLEGFLNYFNANTTGPNATYGASVQGALNGVFFAAGAIGSYAAAYLADRYGRKRAMQISCVVALIATIISTASINVAMLLIGRVIQGFGCGLLHTVCPIYQSEVSIAHDRGKLVGMHGFMLVMGIALVGWAALGCYFIVNPSLSWRLLLATQAIPALLLFGCSFKLLESPRWHLLKGHAEKAKTILCKLHGGPNDPHNLTALQEQIAISEQIELDSQRPNSWIDLFRQPPLRKRMLVGLMMMMVNQNTGQNVLYAYQVNLLAGLGVQGWTPLMILCCYLTYAAFLNGLGGIWLDMFGRRKCLLIGMGGSVVSIILHTVMVARYTGTDNLVGQGAGIAFLFLFITFFGAGVDVTSYVYAAEIFPTAIRSKGVAWSISWYFILACIWTSVAPVALATIGWKFYICFMVLTVVNMVVVYFYFPETNRLTLEEIGALFGDEVASATQVEMGESVVDSTTKDEKDIAGEASVVRPVA